MSKFHQVMMHRKGISHEDVDRQVGLGILRRQAAGASFCNFPVQLRRMLLLRLRMCALETGKQFHSLALKLGMLRGTYVINALVDMYVKCSSIEDAEAVFKNMAERSIVSWNTIIYGYSLHGYGENALEAFWSVLDERCVPNDVNYIGVLSACSHMCLVEEGKKHVKSISEVYGITPTTEHYACMVNILCRAGKFHEVVNFIDEMKLSQKTLIWETVLWASKMHGSVEFSQKAAGKLFELDPKMDCDYVMLSEYWQLKEDRMV